MKMLTKPLLEKLCKGAETLHAKYSEKLPDQTTVIRQEIALELGLVSDVVDAEEVPEVRIQQEGEQLFPGLNGGKMVKPMVMRKVLVKDYITALQREWAKFQPAAKHGLKPSYSKPETKKDGDA